MDAPRPTPRRHALAVGCVLAAAVVVVYAPVRRFDFISFDDPLYVTDNPGVQAGLTARSVLWAFTAAHAANWHPLTWLSHMLDVELFGLQPGAHHLVNVVLHLLNTLLLLGILHGATGALWPSAFVAGLFGLHPSHVESVAWISERKDVLSACFFLLALRAYVAWVRRPGAARYASTALLFVLGLLAKPMVITLPVVLLLLDYWPLRRIAGWRDIRARVAEKLPLFGVAAAAAVVTFLAQRGGGAVVTLDRLPVPDRVANALVAYVRYLGVTLLPVRLAIFYPYRHWPAWAAGGAGAILALISVAVVAAGRRVPALPMGWLWYLSMLAPVSGLVQAGSHSMADRFTYLPQTGLAMMAAWGVAAAIPAARAWRAASATAAAVALLACGLVTARQVSYWRDSETLFRHALEVTEDNYLAHNSLGLALAQRGQFDEAGLHYAEAVRINPRYAEAHLNLGNAYYRTRDTSRAAEQYREALRLSPGLPEAHNSLGSLLAQDGNLVAAIEHYRHAIALRPLYAEPHLNLANALRGLGRCDEAVGEYTEALRHHPEWPEIHYGLALCLAAAGDPAAAEQQLRQAAALARAAGDTRLADDAEARLR